MYDTIEFKNLAQVKWPSTLPQNCVHLIKLDYISI